MSVYISTEFAPGETIDSAVKKLQEFKSKGILVSGNFNGKQLFSDTVTVDGAYKEITGKSYEEYRAEERIRIDNYKKEMEEFNNNLPQMIQEWSKKGEEILDPEFLDEWKRIVPIRAKDIYRGMELDASLEIIKSLNAGNSFEVVAEIIKSQSHSGRSHGLVCAMVQVFSKRGTKFVQSLS